MAGHRWNWRRCPHDIVRCVHGNEIIARGYRRQVCVKCGRALKGPLPEFCTVTGHRHSSFYGDANAR